MNFQDGTFEVIEARQYSIFLNFMMSNNFMLFYDSSKKNGYAESEKSWTVRG